MIDGFARSRLETLIRENRFTIAVVFPTIGAITLVLSSESVLPDILAFNALLLLFGTLVMRSPLLVGAAPVLTKGGLVLVGLMCLYTYAIEIIGVATGMPYGEFAYGVELGPMLFGVPLALPLFFIPLVANAYLLTLLVFPSWSSIRYFRIFMALIFVLGIDFVLDPAAVAIGFWSYDGGGWYYGVPASNYAGWVLSGTIVLVLLDFAIDLEAVRTRLDECEFFLDDFVSFTLLWGVINLIYVQWVPVILAVAGLLLLILVWPPTTDMIRHHYRGIPSR